MKNSQKKLALLKKLALIKKSIVLFDTLKGGTEFNTIEPSQSFDPQQCPQVD